MPAKRLFVSLDLPAPVAKSLVRLDPGLPGTRWEKAEQFHLTLAFFGNVVGAQEKTLRTNLRAIQFGAFFLPLTGLGVFPVKARPKVVWLGVGHAHPHLFQLHKRVIDAALGAGIEPELRPWHPHVTIARCQEVPRHALLQFLREREEYDAGLVRIEAFHLKSSLRTLDGSHYTTEMTVPAV